MGQAMSLTSELVNMRRWIRASVWKLLKDRTEGIQMQVEGEDQVKTTKLDKHFELRIDGPYSKPQDKGNWRHYIEINILINSTRAEDDFYERDNLYGIAQAMLNSDICVYRTGNQAKNVKDNGTLVGVLQLIPVDQIKLSDFGRINETTEVYQAVAEAHYEMYTTDPPE
jgi:hypothetical protein